jgi:hypothetical protein
MSAKIPKRDQPCVDCDNGEKLKTMPPWTECKTCGRFIMPRPQKKPAALVSAPCCAACIKIAENEEAEAVVESQKVAAKTPLDEKADRYWAGYWSAAHNIAHDIKELHNAEVSHRDPKAGSVPDVTD